jgi:hypothetical protein
MYRAVLYRNEGNGVRLLIAYSEVVDSAEVAMKLAEDMKLDRPAPEYWTAVVSKTTAPHSFN